MSLNMEQKQAIVAEVSKVLADAQTAAVAEYRGLTVAQMTHLRRNARQSGVYLRVIKNTLMRRAVQGSAHECLKDHFKGPLAFAASPDPVAVAKVLVSFAKDNQSLRITAGSMGGKPISLTELKVLAALPGREVLLAQLMATMLAPAQKFVQTLNEIPARFVRTLAAVRDQKQAAA